MESSSLDPRRAAETLAALHAARAGLVDDVRLPPGYHLAIGASVALQIGSLAWWLGDPRRWSLAAMAAGAALLLVVVGWQVRRFRATNGVWIDGFVHKAALGTTVTASLCYMAGLGLATWAALAGTWWAVPPIAGLAGVGYAAAGGQWLRRYRSQPEAEAAGPGWPLALLVVVGGLVGLLLLLLQP